MKRNKYILLLLIIISFLKLNASISLLSFGGIKKSNSILLNWRTAAEINSKEFQIERLDLNNKFVKIGTVKASGNSNRVLVYNFTDFDILVNQKVSFYRLKMVDLDSSYKYSNIIKISDENGTKVFTVFPNPFDTLDTLVTKINEVSKQDIVFVIKDKKIIFNGYHDISYTIININGIIVNKSNKICYEIDATHFVDGIYFLIIDNMWYKFFIN